MGERVSFEGQAGQVWGVIFNITEQHVSIQRLRYTANHDSLTGLISRQAFDNVLSRRILDSNPTRGDARLIIELGSGRTVGMEALLKLHESNGDLLTASKVSSAWSPSVLFPSLG